MSWGGGMTNVACLTIVGAGFGLVGSLILAFSLNPLLSMLKTTANAHQFSLQTMGDTNNVVVFSGFDKQLASAASSANFRLLIGALLLSLGFIAQGVAVFLQ